jgi:hypothetical protein
MGKLGGQWLAATVRITRKSRNKASRGGPVTDDIVPILRSEFNNCRCNAYYSGECCCDAKWAEDYVTLAADEIERLRALVDVLRTAAR